MVAIKKVTDLLIILPITLMIAYFSAIYLWYFILFPSYLVDPDHLMENKPVWEMKERYFEDEYIKERTEYFIDWERKKLWQEIDSDFVVYARQHSIFGPIESSWLKRENGIKGEKNYGILL